MRKKKPRTTKPGIVKQVIPSRIPDEPEKAEIHIPSADDLYREIRIENTLTDDKGNEVKLKHGAEVEVTLEADANATVPKETSKTDLTKKKEDEKR